MKPTKPKFKIGAPVTYSGGPRKEYGVIVGMKWDKKQWWWDCRVMFFGTKWPSYEGFRNDKGVEPYLLRYIDTSLDAFTPKVG